MAQRPFSPVFLTFGLILAACGGPAAGTGSQENSVQIQSTNPESSRTASAIQEATRSEPAPAPQADELSPEFADLPAPYSEASYATGKRVFKLCSTCHTVTEDGPNTIGPNLYQIFGRQVGSAEGFNYSNAVKDADFIWSPDQLDRWLESPREFLPGNRMTFQGVRKPADRTAVIAYLMAETGWEAGQ